MRNLTKDLVSKGEIFEPPLVFPSGDKYIVADGNRRTTCLKLLAAPRRAPTVELQQFFADCRKNWQGTFPDKIECRIESDRDRVDDIPVSAPHRRAGWHWPEHLERPDEGQLRRPHRQE
ncbi:MAG: hypothetical protein ACTHNH_22075 [Mesorhizobium sp.]